LEEWKGVDDGRRIFVLNHQTQTIMGMGRRYWIRILLRIKRGKRRRASSVRSGAMP